MALIPSVPASLRPSQAALVPVALIRVDSSCLHPRYPAKPGVRQVETIAWQTFANESVGHSISSATGWLIVGLTLVAILLMEAGFRLVFAVKDHFSAVETPDRRVIEAGYNGEAWPIQHYRELQLLQERWRPFVYFRQKPFSGETIAIDQDGLRLTWEPPPAPVDRGTARAVKVLMLGGSSLWGFGARNDQTIPSLVARKLQEASFRIEMKNLAEIGYVSTQEVVALVRELQSGYRPDLVIFYDGVNDTTSALLEGEAAVTTNEQNRRAEFNIRQSPARLGAALIARLVADSASYRFAQVIGRRLTGSTGAGRPPSADRSSELAAAVVRRYQANLEIVDKLGQGFGFEALHFWQPVVFDKPALTPYEREEAARFAWTREFFQKVHDGLQASAALRDNPRFHDLSQLFAASDRLVFIDYCHTTESANATIADAIAADIEQALRKRSPPTDPKSP